MARKDASKELLLESRKENQTCIDAQMILPKTHYFLIFFMLGSLMPFLVVFMISIGLTTSQAGLIAGTRLVIGSVAAQLWALLIDHTEKRVIFYYILLIGYVGCSFCSPWVANAVSLNNYSIGTNISLTLRNTSNISVIFVDHGLRKQTNQNNSQMFWVMMCVFFSSAVFETSYYGYQDSLIMNLVEKNKHSTFGGQRLFGSIGFGVGNFLSGVASDNYKKANLSKFTGMFFVFLAPGLVLLINGHLLINQTNFKRSNSKEVSKKNMAQLLLRTLFMPSNLIFFISVLMVGIASAVNYAFLFLFMEKNMNVTNTVMTLSIVLQCCAEVVVFWVDEKLLSFFGGNINCVILAAFSYCLRFFLISFVRNAWLVLPIQMLHAFGFALFWSAVIKHTHEISPTKIHTMMFNLVNGLHFGISMVVGSTGGGYLYQLFGDRQFFRIASYTMLAWSIFIFLYYFVLEKYSGCNSTLKADIGLVLNPESEDHL